MNLEGEMKQVWIAGRQKFSLRTTDFGLCTLQCWQLSPQSLVLVTLRC